jgi:hypothetical protein
MKSPLQDPSIKTSCKNCIFAVYDNNTQTGCLTNRIDKFNYLAIEAYDNDKEFYIIKSFCNYYRTSSWNDGVADTNKVKHESSLTIDILVNCENINNNDIDNIINYFESIPYDKDKINIVLCSIYNIENNNRKNILSIYNTLTANKFNVVIVKYANKDTYFHEYVAASKRVVHMIIDKDNIPNIDFINNLNNAMNDDLHKFLISSNGNSKIVSNIAYRIQYVNNPIYSYESNINSLIEEAKKLKLYLEI